MQVSCTSPSRNSVHMFGTEPCRINAQLFPQLSKMKSHCCVGHGQDVSGPPVITNNKLRRKNFPLPNKDEDRKIKLFLQELHCFTLTLFYFSVCCINSVTGNLTPTPNHHYQQEFGICMFTRIHVHFGFTRKKQPPPPLPRYWPRFFPSCIAGFMKLH